jgi:hypothetical protein
MHEVRHLTIAAGLLLVLTAAAAGQTIGNHPARYDSQGILLPWTSWTDTLDREMAW